MRFISERMMGNKYGMGKKMSEEHKAKMFAAKMKNKDKRMVGAE